MKHIRRLIRRIRWPADAYVRSLDRQMTFPMIVVTNESRESAAAEIALHMHGERAWRDWFTPAAREEMAGHYARRMAAE